MISPGTMLGERYRLEERIASGGMGDVWRCTDDVLGRTVAVKILLPSLLEEAGFTERFRVEARTMAAINHPGVVDIYDYGSDRTAGAYLVMEYVEGDALSRTLARVGRLTPARTMALVAQAADALHAAHEMGVVHRDVKPGNLLVRPNGTLVLTDFGIARSIGCGAAHRGRLGARHGLVHLARAGDGRAGDPALRHLRPGRRRLPVPGRAAAVRGREPARDRDAPCPRDAAAAAAGHPAPGTGHRRARDGQGPRRPVGHGGRLRRRSVAAPPAELAAAAPARAGGAPATAMPPRQGAVAPPSPTPTPTPVHQRPGAGRPPRVGGAGIGLPAADAMDAAARIPAGPGPAAAPGEHRADRGDHRRGRAGGDLCGRGHCDLCSRSRQHARRSAPATVTHR